jgi:hypothetical protein
MYQMIVRCMVAAINASGDADFYFVKVDCSEDQFNLGKHYDAAENKAIKEDYEPKLTFDEFESAGTIIVDHFEWDSATIIMI